MIICVKNLTVRGIYVEDYTMTSQQMPSFAPIDNPMIRFNSSGYLTKSGAFYTPQQAYTFVGNLPAFLKWFAKMVHVFGDGFRSVNIVSIYPFVDENKPLGFVFVDADVWCNGKPVPGGALLRGGSVSILLFLVALENTQRRFVVRTLHPRVPIGEANYEENIAGRIAAEEVLVEIANANASAITIHQDECTYLGSFVPSAGGCDEEIEVFRAVKVLPLMEILALKGSQQGISKEEDYIRDIKEKRITDGKALASLALHLLNPLILD